MAGERCMSARIYCEEGAYTHESKNSVRLVATDVWEAES